MISVDEMWEGISAGIKDYEESLDETSDNLKRLTVELEFLDPVSTEIKHIGTVQVYEQETIQNYLPMILDRVVGEMQKVLDKRIDMSQNTQ